MLVELFLANSITPSQCAEVTNKAEAELWISAKVDEGDVYRFRVDGQDICIHGDPENGSWADGTGICSYCARSVNQDYVVMPPLIDLAKQAAEEGNCSCCAWRTASTGEQLFVQVLGIEDFAEANYVLGKDGHVYCLYNHKW